MERLSIVGLIYKAHTPKKWHAKLFEYARSIGIEIFSSPFDEDSVDFLESQIVQI